MVKNVSEAIDVKNAIEIDSNHVKYVNLQQLVLNQLLLKNHRDKAKLPHGALDIPKPVPAASI